MDLPGRSVNGGADSQGGKDPQITFFLLLCLTWILGLVTRDHAAIVTHKVTERQEP